MYCCLNKFLIYFLFFLSSCVSIANASVYVAKTYEEESKKGGDPKKILKKARKSTVNGDYDIARENYLKLIALDSLNFDYNFELGLNYFYTFDHKAKAIDYFEKALKYSPKDTIGEIYYYLGGTYQFLGRLEEAIEAYTRFKPFIKGNREGLQLNTDVNVRIAECYKGKAFATSVDKKVKIENLGLNVNSKYADYVPLVSDDETILMFTSRRNISNAKTDWSDEKYYENMFISRKQNGEFMPAEQFDVEDAYVGYIPNTPYHDAVISVSADGKSLFTYRDNSIWLSELKNDSVWEGPVILNENINVKKGYQSHAYLAKDGVTLYFTSDRKGGFGGIDIYKSTKQEDGVWGPAENLGPNINTKLSEDSPWLSDDGQILYFSSKGHNSIGGYDIFQSNLVDGQWSEPINMGRPINSPSDDVFYVPAKKKSNQAYFSSLRPDGLGDMDIYRITYLSEPEFTSCELIADEGLNNNTGYFHFNSVDTVVLGEEISFDASASKVLNSEVGNIYWDYGDGATGAGAKTKHTFNVLGTYEVKMELQAFHQAKLTTNNYCVKKQVVVLSEHEMEQLLASKNKITKDSSDALASAGNKANVKVDTKASAKIALENVFYDFDKAGIRVSEEAILNRNIEKLKANPELKIKIKAHTDSKGSEKYNNMLSEKRARAAADYMIKNGISRKRIAEIKGFGESALLNNCTDNVECSEEEHQKNRRTEFEIISKP